MVFLPPKYTTFYVLRAPYRCICLLYCPVKTRTDCDITIGSLYTRWQIAISIQDVLCQTARPLLNDCTNQYTYVSALPIITVFIQMAFTLLSVGMST